MYRVNCTVYIQYCTVQSTTCNIDSENWFELTGTVTGIEKFCWSPTLWKIILYIYLSDLLPPTTYPTYKDYFIEDDFYTPSPSPEKKLISSFSFKIRVRKKTGAWTGEAAKHIINYLNKCKDNIVVQPLIKCNFSFE